MITRIPRSSFSANINNTAQTNEHQTLSELFYKELEDKFSGKELATPLLKSFSENCRQNGRHIFSNKDFVIKFSTSVLQADKKEITIINKNEITAGSNATPLRTAGNQRQSLVFAFFVEVREKFFS